MLKGLIISNISNLYQVKLKDKIIECVSRGKMKQDEIFPVVGDYVEIEELENENTGVICNILERTMYSKRPKIANLTQIILVISLKSPKPDLLLLDINLPYTDGEFICKEIRKTSNVPIIMVTSRDSEMRSEGAHV